MHQFVHDENLLHLRKQLALSPSPSPQRDEIMRQIATELLNNSRVVSEGKSD